MYEQDIEQHNSQLSYQKFKTMVKRCLDQRIRARSFEARMKEPRQEHQRNTEAKGNPSVCKESQENGRRKVCAQERTLVVSFTMRINVGKRCDRPLLFQNRRRTAIENSSRGKVLSGRSPSGKRSRRPCKDYISGECTNHVTFGVLPSVNITKHNRDANLVKSASSGTKS